MIDLKADAKLEWLEASAKTVGSIYDAWRRIVKYYKENHLPEGEAVPDLKAILTDVSLEACESSSSESQRMPIRCLITGQPMKHALSDRLVPGRITRDSPGGLYVRRDGGWVMA